VSVSTHKPLILIALFLIIIFGSGLRLFYLGSFPPKGESYDEYAWTFLGTNLLTSLTPKSWSYFPYPIKEHKTIQGNYYPIVKPFLDNPPLFSLFPGSIQALSGRPYDNPLPLSILRLSMLPIAALNMLLIYLICSRLFGEKTDLFGTLLFATIPTIVFANRLILSENFLTALLFLHIWIVTSEKIQRRSLRLPPLSRHETDGFKIHSFL